MALDLDRATADTAYFGRECVPEYVCDEVPYFHQAIYGLLDDENVMRAAIAAPRESSKTTCVDVHILKRIALKDYRVRDFILIIAESQDQAIGHIENLRAIIEDGASFRRNFGDLVGDKKWGAECLVTGNGTRIEALGTRQRVRGRIWQGVRPRLVVLDDFESEQNSDSPEDRKRVRQWIRRALFPAVRRGKGRIVAIGTFLHEDCYLPRIFRPESRGWRKLFLRSKWREEDPHRRLYSDDGMLWPKPHLTQEGEHVAFDQEWYDKTRADYEADGELDSFFTEYDNDILPSNPVISPDDIQTYLDYRVVAPGHVEVKRDSSDDWRVVHSFLGVDPSTRENEQASWCVLMPIGVDDAGTVYQFPYVRQRFGRDILKITNAIFDLDRIYGFISATIETTGSQVYISGEVQRQQGERSRYFMVHDENPRKGKESKVHQLQPRLKSGKLLLARHAPELVHELTYHGKTQFSDCADGLFLATQNAFALGSSAGAFGDGRRGRHGRWNWKVA